VIEADELKAIMSSMGALPPRDPDSVPADIPPVAGPGAS